MINITHLREEIIRPVLRHLRMHSPAAENLLVGTALTESRLHYLKQINGPALGLYQMEPATRKDIFDHFLAYRPNILNAISDFMVPDQDKDQQLIWNLYYATAMARIQYYRRPEPLPDADDIRGLGAYYKQWYNTPVGKGSVQKFVEDYNAGN